MTTKVFQADAYEQRPPDFLFFYKDCWWFKVFFERHQVEGDAVYCWIKKQGNIMTVAAPSGCTYNVVSNVNTWRTVRFSLAELSQQWLMSEDQWKELFKSLNSYSTHIISENQSGHGHFMRRLAVRLIKLTGGRSVFSVLNIFKPEHAEHRQSLCLWVCCVLMFCFNHSNSLASLFPISIMFSHIENH